MRADMHKVIVERPRPGSAAHVPRRRHRVDWKRVALDEDGEDDLPKRIGHRRSSSLLHWYKSLNDHLAPLRRYLDKQVGRPWNKVWSEICAEAPAHSILGSHLRRHVFDYVAHNTMLIDGALYYADHCRRPERLRPRFPPYYADPANGLLRRNRAKRASKRR